VFSVFINLARSHGTAIIIVTHDLSIAAQCDRMLKLENGGIRPC
jgi:lipoprotein-releasing system ATP-binding protein